MNAIVIVANYHCVSINREILSVTECYVLGNDKRVQWIRDINDLNAARVCTSSISYK